MAATSDKLGKAQMWNALRKLTNRMPRTRKHSAQSGRMILSARDAETFLKGMDKPVVYNEELTAAMEENERRVISSWDK